MLPLEPTSLYHILSYLSLKEMVRIARTSRAYLSSHSREMLLHWAKRREDYAALLYLSIPQIQLYTEEIKLCMKHLSLHVIALRAKREVVSAYFGMTVPNLFCAKMEGVYYLFLRGTKEKRMRQSLEFTHRVRFWEYDALLNSREKPKMLNNWTYLTLRSQPFGTGVHLLYEHNAVRCLIGEGVTLCCHDPNQRALTNAFCGLWDLSSHLKEPCPLRTDYESSTVLHVFTPLPLSEMMRPFTGARCF